MVLLGHERGAREDGCDLLITRLWCHHDTGAGKRDISSQRLM